MERVNVDCPEQSVLHWLLDMIHTNWLPGGDYKQYQRDVAQVVEIAREVNEAA